MRRFALTSFVLVAFTPFAPRTAPAQHVAADVSIARFHRVDEHLYRGAQPTKLGLGELQKLGIRTILNVREEGDAEVENERRIVESLGMRFVHVPIKDGSVLTWGRRIPPETVKRFFEVLESNPGPVFLHCKRGTDRTGALVAFYRIVRNGWDAARAVKEANERGMRLWYRGLRKQIETFNPSLVQSAPAAR